MSQHRADVPTASPLMDRRNFAATASLLCAPAIVRASSLMPIKGGGLDTACVHMNMAIWLRYELFRGQLSDASYRASELQLGEFVKGHEQ
jgi:hypothetical protein